MARANLITNANIDDRRNPHSIELQVKALEEDQACELVYSDYLVTNFPNETFEFNHCVYIKENPEFSPELIYMCLPGPQPMWRKFLHEKYGFFDEQFKAFGDWEMWIRAVSMGAKFKKIPEISGLYYLNPKGLSTDIDKDKQQSRLREYEIVQKKYPTLVPPAKKSLKTKTKTRVKN